MYAADDIVTVKKRNQLLFAAAEEKIEVDLALVRQNLNLDEKSLLKCLNIGKIEYYYHGREIKNIKR